MKERPSVNTVIGVGVFGIFILAFALKVLYLKMYGPSVDANIDASSLDLRCIAAAAVLVGLLVLFWFLRQIFGTSESSGSDSS